MADPNTGLIPGTAQGAQQYAYPTQPGAIQLQPGMAPYAQVAQYTQPPQASFQQQQQAAALKSFWVQQMEEVQNTSSDPAEFRNHQLPLARIKKIMKSDEDVRMISAEAPVLFAKACDMFILELTLRSWIHSEENKRRTLQRNDIAAAITKTDIFDFLVDIVPRDDKAEAEGGAVGAVGAPGAVPGVQQAVQPMQAVGAMPYYLPPGHQAMLAPGSEGLRPGIDPTMMYGGPQFMAAARMQQWPQQMQPPQQE